MNSSYQNGISNVPTRNKVKLSSLESDVLLNELYSNLLVIPDEEKTKVVISWLANSYADLSSFDPFTLNDDLRSKYVTHLKLLNTLVNNSSFEKASELARLFVDQFLNPFILPSVNDETQSPSRIARATEYFRLVCETLNQPLLVQKLIVFTISHLLHTLIVRLSCATDEILLATLSLFKTLLELYCEDFWYELVLQYLLPMKHLMVDDRQRAIEEINFYESSLLFINALPSCILEIVSPESLAEHYTMYSSQELARLQDIGTATSKGIPSSKSTVSGIPVFEDAIGTQTRNPVFPLWAFKYDGTDFLHASRKFRDTEPEEFLEDDKFIFPKELESIPDGDASDSSSENSSSNSNYYVSETSDLEEIDLSTEDTEKSQVPQEQTEGTTSESEEISLPNESDSNKDERRNSEAFSHSMYLGPFLNNMYNLLDQWTRLDPDVILIVSDIFSILASSRLPLLSTLFLDMSIVLQPCYPSFSSSLHGIKMKLDGSMQKRPAWFVKQIYQQSALGTEALMSEMNSERDDSTIKANKAVPATAADVLKSRVLNSRTFSFISKFSSGSASTIANIARIIADGSTIRDNRVLNRSASGFESKEDENCARKMTIRAILFSHWLLELAAIAHQLCWSQSSLQVRRDS